MTKPELPEPTQPPADDRSVDLLDEAISWFTGRSRRDETPAGGEADLPEAAPDLVDAGAGADVHTPEPLAAYPESEPEPESAAPDTTHADLAGAEADLADADLADAAGTMPLEGLAPTADATTDSTVGPRGETPAAAELGPDHSVDEPAPWADEDVPAGGWPDAALADSTPEPAAAAFDAQVPEAARDEWVQGPAIEADSPTETPAAVTAPYAAAVPETEAAPEAAAAPVLATVDSTPSGALGAPAHADDRALDPLQETAVHDMSHEVDEPPVGAIDSEAGAAVPSEPPASLFRDPGAPAMAAVAGAAAGGVAAAGSLHGADAAASVIDDDAAARQRAEEREARDRQLGTVQPLASVPARAPLALPTTYRFLPSTGLLLLRIVTAGIVGVRAFMHAMNIPDLAKLWADHTIFATQATTIAWAQTGVEALIVVLLVLGLGTRVAGALLAILAGCLLAFMLWGAANPFQPGLVGFIGEIEVLLAAVGVFFLTAGGGRAAIDGGIHQGRIERKNERLIA